MERVDLDSVLNFIGGEESRVRQENDLFKERVAGVEPILRDRYEGYFEIIEGEKRVFAEEAGERIRSVILPWHQEIQASGKLGQVFEYMNRTGRLMLPLSDLIVYQSWDSRKKTRFEREAKEIVTRSHGDEKVIQRMIEQSYTPNSGSLQTEQVYLYGASALLFNKDCLVANKMPLETNFGMRWARARWDWEVVFSDEPIAQSELAEDQSSIWACDSEVLVDLAGQIESGWIWEVLLESWREESREKFSERELAERYWQKRRAWREKAGK